jgi:hypothetical protein
VVNLGHQMLTTLSSISNISVFRYAKTATKGRLMEFMGRSVFGQL